MPMLRPRFCTVHDDPGLRQLDPGERAAILLAQQEAGALLLIDDAAGRSEATRRGIPSPGTLGILRALPSVNCLTSHVIEEFGCNRFPGFPTPYRGTPGRRYRAQTALEPLSPRVNYMFHPDSCCIRVIRKMT